MGGVHEEKTGALYIETSLNESRHEPVEMSPTSPSRCLQRRDSRGFSFGSVDAPVNQGKRARACVFSKVHKFESLSSATAVDDLCNRGG